MSEKVRAASQRSKIRGLYDLSEVAGRDCNRDLLRSLAVIKLRDSDQDNLDYTRFVAQIENGEDYDLDELTSLLRKDQRPSLQDMIRRKRNRFRCLDQVTDLERKITQDAERHCKNEIEQLKADVVKRAG